MRDGDVRSALKVALHSRYADDKETRIVEEMGVWSGSVRIDLAVINGELTGYELKSDCDTLQRLPGQEKLYSAVFDRVCLIVGSKHEAAAREIVPKWWGITIAKLVDGTVQLHPKRQARRNPSPDALLVARLLWKQEAVEILEKFGLARGYRSKAVSVIHERLANEVPFAELSRHVRLALKSRKDWLGEPVGNM